MGNTCVGPSKKVSASVQKLTKKIDETKNGPSKLVAPAVVTDTNATGSRKQDSILKSGDSSGTKPVSHPPQKKRAFHLSAPEDYLELDDDTNPNGVVSPFSTLGKETTVSTAVAHKTTSAIETALLEKPPGSSVLMPSKNFTIDGKPHVRTADESKVEEKVDVPTSITSSASDPIFKTTTGAFTAASNTSLGSNESTTPNGSVDNVPQVPFTFSSSVGESAVFKFASSDSKPRSSMSSITVAGAVDSMPKALDSDNAGAKTNIVTGFSAGSSEPAVSSAALTSSSTSPANIITFGNSSNQNNGPAASSLTFFPLFPAVATKKFSFCCSSLAASNSSVSVTANSTSTGTTASIPAVVAAGNIRSSTQVATSGSGIFGFSSSAMTTGNSQSLGSVFGTTTGSVASGFATSSKSQSVAFGSSASSPLFGLTGNTAFSSGSSLLPSSSSAINIFNAGTTSGHSTPASSSGANPVSSSSGTSSTVFGLSSCQTSKSPFNSSSSPSSGISFGSSFCSSSLSTSRIFFGTSTPVTTNMQPPFGSSSPAFPFGLASVNNDQMSMEDSMARVFGQQPAPLQSNFAFGASTPTGANPFQFGSQQNIAPQNSSPFQASGSLEFNAGGSFSLGTEEDEKSGRKLLKVKDRSRKK